MKYVVYVLSLLVVVTGFASGCAHVSNTWHTCTEGVCALTSATEKAEQEKFSDDEFESHLKKIDTVELKKLLRGGVILLDARAPKYTDGRVIPGADVVTIKTPKEDILKRYPNKKALIVTYCGDIHCPASLRLAMYLHNIGYTNLEEYSRGIDGWEKDGNKTVPYILSQTTKI